MTTERTRELNRQAAQRYRDNNRERARANARKCYDAHRDEYVEKLRVLRGRNPLLQLIAQAKNRAKTKGWEFNIEASDLSIPEICPVLGVPIQYVPGCRSGTSPSIDRIDSTKGYIKGNVRIISDRANRLKSNATYEEMLLVCEDLRQHTHLSVA